MSKVSYTQTAFNGGEISPRMMGRTDFDRYKIGLSLCENGIVLPQGGVTRRPGFQFIHEVKDSSLPVELVPFEFSEDQAYVLEFGDLYMRVFADGGIVVTPDAYTVLLLHGDGLDGTINILDDSPLNHTISVYGNAQVDTGFYKFATGSLLFGGASAYLSVADHASWAFGTGEWCIECWVNFSNLNKIMTFFYQGDTHAGDFNWFYFDAPAYELVYRSVDGGAVVVDLSTTWNPSMGVWYKLAVFRILNNWYLTIGGVVYASSLALVATSPDQTGALQIGTGNTTLTVVYDTSPTCAVFSTAGGATRASGSATGGSFSMYFDGTDDSFSTPNHANWDLATNNTIQFWVKHVDHVGTEGYIEHYQAAGEKWQINHVHGAGLTFQLVTGAVATINLQPAVINSEITDTNWHHVLFHKLGNNYALYLDGKCCTYVYDTSAATAFTGFLYLGQSHDGAGASQWFQGYIDDLIMDDANVAGLAPQDIVLDSSTLNGYATRYSYPGFSYGSALKFGTASIRFDGTDDYLTYAASDNFNVTNKTNATVDCWVYLSNVTGTRIFTGVYVDANNYWWLGHVDGTGLQFIVVTGGVTRLTMTGGEIDSSAWDHIALCKVGSAYGIYKNGNQVAIGTLTTYDLSTGVFSVAAINAGSFFNGYMDELRITHSDSFTSTPNSILLDSSDAAHGVAARYSQPYPDYTNYKWGVSALNFDGADDYLAYVDSADWDFTTGTNGTIDLWVRLETHAAQSMFCGQYVDATHWWGFYHSHGNGLKFYMVNGAAVVDTGFGGEIADSNWHHVAVCKVGNAYGCYKDGIQYNYVSDADTVTLASNLFIGQLNAGSYLDGQIDELRITRANSFSASPNVGLTNTITVPTGAHTSDSNTKLLMHFEAPTITVPTAAHSATNTKLLMHFDNVTFDPSPNRYRPSNPRSSLLLHVASDSFYFQGRMDEVRISKGESRYPGTFTPETTEFPAAGGYAIYELATEYTYDQVAELRVVQSADTLYICHPDMNVRKLTRTDHDNWTITSIDWSPPPWNEVNATAITLDPSATTGAGITITASAPFFDNTMIGCYFKQANGYYLITGVSNSTTATATVKDDLDDHVATATWYRSVWDLDQGYPTCATFHEDRLVLAGQREHPLTVYFSRTGDYEDMAQAASAADDPFDATIWSQQQNQIKWLVSGKRLFVGTVGSEFWMTGSTIDTPMAYNSIQAKPESSVGSEGIAPLVIDSTVVFVQDGGERVRLWSYNLSSDGYESNDLSILADHLTAYNPIYKIQYAQYPYSVLWATTYDGTLIGCTIVKNNNVLAWHHHYTGTTDTIETIAVIPGVNGDELWVVAARTIDGSVVQYVERLNDDFYGTAVEDGIFMDSAISYDGTPATSFSGADHLEGETVQVLADGVYIGTKTISSGAFTLTNAASVVHCGIPYNTNIETLPWNTGDDRMTAESSKKRIVNVMANVLETCELSFGKDGSNLLAYPMTNGTLYTQRFAQEHNGDWGYEPTIYFRQSYPFPMTLLSVTADVEIGGR